MPELELVNPVPVDDIEAWGRQFATTLLFGPHNDDFPRHVARWKAEWLPERAWAVRDHGRFVATLATRPRILTIPGPGGGTADIRVDALTAVTVAATHRRRGLLTRMLGESLQAANDRGDALSVLLAAEWPIYARYGYAPAARYANYTYLPRRHGGAIDPVPGGVVRQIEPDELFKYAPALFDRYRRLRPGQVDRPSPWWEYALGMGFELAGGPRDWYVHEGPDGPDGFLTWKVTRNFELEGGLGAIAVDGFVAATDEAYRNLWAYLGGMDIIDEITFWNRPIDEPARFLMADGRALRQTYTGDFLWVCLLDVPAALSARTYATEGQLVLDVTDDSTRAYARGRYLLEASPDGATCTPTSHSPDITLSAFALASAYLGGHTIRTIAVTGAVDEHTPGSVRLLDAMLATPLQPWCQTPF